MPSESRDCGSWPVDIIGHTTGERRHIGAISLAACHKKQNKYQKVHTYEHSLQTLTSFAFMSAGPLRASACRELAH